MKKKNYFIGVLSAAVEAGFELDMNDRMDDIVMEAEDYLLENEPYGHVFEQVDLGGHGMSQGYTWVDEESGKEVQMSGEIFTFAHYKADAEVYFHLDWEKNEFTPVNWFDIPDEYHMDERKHYVFVFDKQVKSDGKIAWLYDGMA